MMAGHSRWKTLQAKRLAEADDAAEHPEYEQAGRDLRLGDQLRAIRRSRNLTQKEVAERARISQPALSRIELGGGVPDIETLQRLGRAMGVRFRIIVGDENAEQEENLLVSLTSRACRSGLPSRQGLRWRNCRLIVEQDVAGGEQACLQQAGGQRRTARDHDVLAGLLLELG
jgi:transcriptional regulator with XRE-family HTH domain